MRMRTLLLLIGLAAVPCDADAQSRASRPPDGRSARVAVRIAKWTLLAGAVAAGAYALDASQSAEGAYERLGQRCQQDGSRCAFTPAGQYVDPVAERLFRDSQRFDSRARTGIIVGEVTLVGSLGLFIYDLRNRRGPADIPFPVPVSASTVAIGVRLRL